MSVGRLLRTLRHLTPEQLVGQVRVRAQRAAGWPRPPTAVTPPFGGVLDTAAPPLPPRTVASARNVQAGRLRFLNETRELGAGASGGYRWEPEGASLLWRYNLHYLDYLWDVDATTARAITADWIAQHAPAARRVGWEPYPTSLRLQNWALVHCVRDRSETLADTAFTDLLWRSVWAQVEHLRTRLETHLQGNHLLENAIALTLVGSVFEGPAAAEWKAQGLSLLAHELQSQVLLDGMHYERSPMYQLHVLRALHNLQCVGDPESDAVTEPVVERMRAAARKLIHPDGQIALLNDAALNIEPAPRPLVGPAATVAVGGGETFQLASAGYFGARSQVSGGEHYVVCDAGLVGPDHIPGHAHADTLGFELSLFGARLAVDTGTFDYLPTPMRRHCRSTAAHNTVELDGQDQSEMWGAFRVGRRARPRAVIFQQRPSGFTLEAEHDGYKHLPGAPIHRRRFHWEHAGRLTVTDRVRGDRSTVVRSRIHLHPDVRVVTMRGQRVVLAHGSQRVEVWFDGGGHLARRAAAYCPELGRQHASEALVYTQLGAQVGCGFCISAQQLHGYTLEGGAIVGDGGRPAQA